jgi:thioesterase domain-containing protein
MDSLENETCSDLLLGLANAGILLRKSKGGFSCKVPKSASVDASWLSDVTRRLTSYGYQLANNLAADEFVYPLAVNVDSDASVICLHPITGVLWEYREFLAKTPRNWSVFGIHAGAWYTGRAVPRTIKEMALEYSKRIVRTEFVRRPIVLYGFSSGGLIALEVAKCLRQRGVHVELVVFGDTKLSYVPTQQSVFAEDTFAWWMFLFHCLPPATVASSNRLKGRFKTMTDNERISFVMSLMGSDAQRALPFAATLEEGFRRFQKFRWSLQAYVGYEPGQYGGKAAYVSSRTSSPFSSLKLREALVGSVRQDVVAGMHMDVAGEVGSTRIWEIICKEVAESSLSLRNRRAADRRRFSFISMFTRWKRQ